MLLAHFNAAIIARGHLQARNADERDAEGSKKHARMAHAGCPGSSCVATGDLRNAEAALLTNQFFCRQGFPKPILPRNQSRLDVLEQQ